MTTYLTGVGAIAVAAMALTFAFPAANAATSEAACKKLWSQADRDRNQSVTMAEAQIAMAGKTKAAVAADANKDGKLSAAEFLAACKKGAFGK